MNTQDKLYIVGYIEDEVLKDALKKSTDDTVNIDESKYQYFKCDAPDVDSIFSVCARRFPDVHVVNVSLEDDYVKALKTLANVPNTQNAYLYTTTAPDGSDTTEVAVDIKGIKEEQLVAEMNAGDLKNTFLKMKSLFNDESIRRIHWTE